jgi:RNA-directed DNA polymerase
MTGKPIMPVRFMNPVEPLGQHPTAMRTTDTGGHDQLALWSGAVSGPIGDQGNLDLWSGDVDSSATRRTPATTPLPRTSRTATATGTTRTTSFGFVLSANSSAPSGAPFSMADLVQAWLDCRRHKRQTESAQAFEANVERNLCALREELLSQAYQPGRSICFVVTHPRPREVWAAAFRDRVVHHLLYNAIAPRFLASFDAGSAACIPGRGTLYAAQRLETSVRSITQNWAVDARYLKLDLSNFFVAIDKRVLQTQLHRKVTDPFWRWLTDAVLMHDPRADYEFRGDIKLMQRVPPHKQLANAPVHTGLPIGNLSSQFFANVHLNGLDQFCKHQVKARHYVRYVDDMVLLHQSAEWLHQALRRITAWLPAHLGVQINPRKTIEQPIARGIDFVGHVIKPWHRTTRNRTVATAAKRLQTMPASRVFAAGNSYLGLLRQATHSHTDRARLANVLRGRGHTVNGDLTKIYRRSE